MDDGFAAAPAAAAAPIKRCNPSLQQHIYKTFGKTTKTPTQTHIHTHRRKEEVE
jgi:hypothetical protein